MPVPNLENQDAVQKFGQLPDISQHRMIEGSTPTVNVNPFEGASAPSMSGPTQPGKPVVKVGNPFKGAPDPSNLSSGPSKPYDWQSTLLKKISDSDEQLKALKKEDEDEKKRNESRMRIANIFDGLSAFANSMTTAAGGNSATLTSSSSLVNKRIREDEALRRGRMKEAIANQQTTIQQLLRAQNDAAVRAAKEKKDADDLAEKIRHNAEMEAIYRGREQGLNDRSAKNNETKVQVAGMREQGLNDRAAAANATKETVATIRGNGRKIDPVKNKLAFERYRDSVIKQMVKDSSSNFERNGNSLIADFKEMAGDAYKTIFPNGLDRFYKPTADDIKRMAEVSPEWAKKHNIPSYNEMFDYVGAAVGDSQQDDSASDASASETPAPKPKYDSSKYKKGAGSQPQNGKDKKDDVFKDFE